MSDEDAELARLRAREAENIENRLKTLEILQMGHPAACPLREPMTDLEKRMRLVERVLYIGMGGLAALNLLGIWKLFEVNVRGGP